MVQNIFISGVSSGIGHGLTKHYLEKGNHVWGVSRRSVPEFNEFSNFHHLKADILADNFTTILESFFPSATPFDLLVLNAGVLGEIQSIQQANVEELKQTMETNLWAQKKLLDVILKKTPRLFQTVAISSGASINGSKGWAGYSLSKAACNMLIQLYASEFPSTHFTSLAPGLVDTAMQDYLCEKVDISIFPSVEKLIQARGTPQMPKPEELAPTLELAMGHCLDFPSGSFQDIRKLKL
jgi:NAD(P)-dependent dehydrogenase (short-subunit alcohol dehydrogenase family)